ncbi:MAG: hypothetical protein ABII64_07190 [Elusimicrobiota bacterium]
MKKVILVLFFAAAVFAGCTKQEATVPATTDAPAAPAAPATPAK